ncbi:MAG: HEPN domain-containing protein [Candidatus Dependentiae bacterium]|nr:HEPN domain-containing protein [Candidatus Dependentiae bacterium]
MRVVDRWLSIAQDDFATAKYLAKGEYYPASVYYCQQAAEKALKAFLASRNICIVKTHDLVGLIELCNETDPSFDQLLKAAEYLTPFSSKFRYPSEFDLPDASENSRAIEDAMAILKFVRRKLTPKRKKVGQGELF